ncbi:maleylacetoacetate isomerase isoform 2 [Stylonychia lemnae]|uniref:Maleylacetoacetate isomerase isoform 2 n=1 Tax=Stylonychia lemnae TaxID=5949 RepID=A0A078ACJ3_STYLE|nr:maleylacetoacetate isomerase isoform 2 [Stylonychia lemnae]|eukprot:CDW79894.1 maleylacetoacetate isomerase isoform 2 [Stylonychia lemnae]
MEEVASKVLSTKPTLFSYFRSSASWRVRLVLALKGIEFTYQAVNITKDGGAQQYSEDYAKMNPMNRVPALFIDGKCLGESIAIIEYLEETRPDTRKVFPSDPYLRAKARQLTEIINSGIQPLQNLEVLNKIEDELKGDRKEWAQHFIKKGMNAFEEIIKETRGKYCIGDEVSIADVCLIPQCFAAERFGVDLATFPNIKEIRDSLTGLPEFIAGDLKSQPDYVA